MRHIDDPRARAEARNRWYAEVYHPWRSAVSAAIADDPERARALFVDTAGLQELPPPAKRAPRPAKPAVRTPTRQERRRRELALLAAALRAGGHSWRGVAALLDLPKSTVHDAAVDVDLAAVPDAVTAALVSLRVADLLDEVRSTMATADPATRAQLAERLTALTALQTTVRRRLGGKGRQA
ncbi:hypothetical protein [Micromonospora sp. WMMD1274]|uniref:hypothetical protein n=1 Tax=Micromonospora sp. WMMD1274 TaxID=3404116 RepID=UPI003B930AFA